METMTFCVPCLFGLEGLVGDELRRLELSNVRDEDRRVFFEGDFAAMAKANLCCRMGERVMIELIRARDERGAEELLRRFGALIRYVIAPILPDERDREDCLAEVLMRIWDGIGGYDPERGSWRAYITAAARNAALNRARAERVHTAGLPDGVSDQPGPEEAVIAAEEIDELRRAIDALPPGDRALIYRKYYYRQSTAQMASELGLTARAVEGRLYRIKKRLGAALGGERNG